MKTKARDRIRLPDGTEMTLGEALDSKHVTLVESTWYSPPRYFARANTPDGSAVTWEVRKSLYRSRANLPFEATLADVRAKLGECP